MKTEESSRNSVLRTWLELKARQTSLVLYTISMEQVKAVAKDRTNQMNRVPNCSDGSNALL